jgi:ketosteroid isomerase-like protein
MQSSHTLKNAGIALLLAFTAAAALAADMPGLDPKDPRFEDRKALRDLLVATEHAFNKIDVEGVIGVLADDAVVVWQDGVRTVSHDEVRQHYKQTFQGAGAVLKSLDIKAALAGPARFYGANQAVAYGTTKETYQLVAGGKVGLDGLWTTHVAKQDGKWKVTALHFSTNPFDNDVIRKAGQASWIFGMLGIVIGLVAGWFAGRRRKA